jgi:transmembrane sensor
MSIRNQIDRLQAQSASEWHETLEHGGEAQRAEFVAWLKQSPAHVREYLEIVYTEQVLKHADAGRHIDVEALLAQASPAVVPFGAGGERAIPRNRRRLRSWFAVAAAAAACLALVPVLHRQFFATSPHATTVGEQRSIQLADSSIVTLNADSRIEVRMNGAGRDITLVRGEALFKVAPDPRRPFRVFTDTAVVQALGTQFNVYERPHGTRVSVLEGLVRVTPQVEGGSGAGASTRAESLGAGQEAQVRRDGTIERNVRADVMKTVAWRERRLIFEEAPLEEMVYEFNRYSRAVRLRLEGVPPGSHHYNGIFDAADPDSLAQLLAREPDLEIERRAGEIVIRRRR